MGYVACVLDLGDRLSNLVHWQTFNIIAADATECLGLGNGTFASSSTGTVAGTATSVATASANLSVRLSRLHGRPIHLSQHFHL
jgi:hypothetical protein